MLDEGIGAVEGGKHQLRKRACQPLIMGDRFRRDNEQRQRPACSSTQYSEEIVLLPAVPRHRSTGRRA